VNEQSLLSTFQLTVDLPLICRLHTFDSFLQEKVLLVKSFDWLAPPYQQVIPYISLQTPLDDDYLEILPKLYTETPSVIKENVLNRQLEKLLKLVLDLIEDLKNPESLIITVRAILVRYEHLFLEKDLKKRVKKMLKDFIEKTLRANPDFLIELTTEFIEYLGYHKNEEVQDLVMHIIWLTADIIPSSFNGQETHEKFKEWSMVMNKFISPHNNMKKTAKSYCNNMEIILHQLVYFLTLNENLNKNKGRIDELVCLLLGAMMKISVKYPMLKQNTLLIHLKLFGRKEDLPSIVNSKVVTNLKLLKNSTTSLLLFGNCL